MNGRLEHQLQTESKMRKRIQGLPDSVKEWYTFMNASGALDYKTVELYLQYMKKYLLYCRNNNVDINNASTYEISEYMGTLRTREKNGVVSATSNSYKATVWFALNSYYKFMRASHYIDENPMENIPRASAAKDLDTIERVYLTPSELQEVVNAVKEGVGSDGARAKQKTWRSRDLAIILLLIYTGIRVTALTEINMDDVDLENCVIRVTDKRDKTFDCVIPEELVPYLQKWKDDRYEFLNYNFFKEPFFISNQRTRISPRSVERLVEKYTEAIGKRVTPHKFRASYATNLYDQTRDIYFVQQCMGHCNIETTKRYIGSGANAKAEASRIMSGMLKI